MKKIFEFLYYLNVHLCILAMSLSAASARVLNGEVKWIPVVIAGLGTYVIYNLDNLVDWSKESYLFNAITMSWNSYRTWCLITIPVSLIVILALSLLVHINFLLFLVGLGLASGIYIAITFLINDRRNSVTVLHSAKLFDAFVWAVIIVLIPNRYGEYPFVAQTAMAVAYTWMLVWVGVMVWDLSYTIQFSEHIRTLANIKGENHIVLLTKIACASAFGLATIDILLGYFPWYNISVLAWPMLSYLLLTLWPKLCSAPRLYNVLFSFINALGGILVIVAYNLFETLPLSL